MQSQLTNYEYRVDDLILVDGEPTAYYPNLDKVIKALKSMDSSQGNIVPLQPNKSTKFRLNFDPVEVDRLIVVGREVQSISVELTLRGENEESDPIVKTHMQSKRDEKTVVNQGFARHMLKVEIDKGAVFNHCEVTLVAEAESAVEPACSCIMIRCAKNQLRTRGPELRDLTRLATANAATTSAKKNVLASHQSRLQRLSQDAASRGSQRDHVSQEEAKQGGSSPTGGKLDVVMEDETQTATEKQGGQNNFSTPKKMTTLTGQPDDRGGPSRPNNNTHSSHNQNPYLRLSKPSSSEQTTESKPVGPVLKLNVYNAHLVDASVPSNAAISITDPEVAAKVAMIDRQNQCSHSSAEKQSKNEEPEETKGHANGLANGMKTRSTRSGAVPQQNGANRQNNGAVSSSTQSKNSRRIPCAPVTLDDETRRMAELEAAVVYWQGLIELRLQRGEEVSEEDGHYLKLIEATDAFQKGLEPYLSVEEIVELE